MVKISVIGICGNSTFLTVDKFHESGQTLIANGTFQEIGGKGSNQAVAAARMGAQVSFLAAVGDDSAGDACHQLMKEENVEDCLVVKPGQITTFAFILTDKAGENRVTVYQGAELCPADVDGYETQIAESDLLLLQNEVPADVNQRAIELADKHGVKVILNPAPADEREGKVWLVTPNEQEKAGLGKLRYAHCITTLGGNGCSIDERKFIPALPVRAVDTTGAGDTFNGVLAVCLAEGMCMETACQWAVAASGISVTRHGAQSTIPYREEIERRIL